MRKILFLLCMGFSLSICSSCKSDATVKESVTFLLPEISLEESYPEISRWLVEITVGTKEKEQFFTTEKAFTLSVNKNIPCSISTWPVCRLTSGEETQFFKPAGTIYPYEFDYSTKCQRLSWEGGYAAFIFNLLYESHKETGISQSQICDYISSFNWKKFIEVIRKNQALAEENPDSPFYNPWQINTQKLMENLSGGTFSASLLETKNLFTVKNQSFCLLSDYIPQNKLLLEKGTVTLQKNTQQLLLYNQTYGLVLQGTSSKNLSQQWIFMPIFKEDL